MPPFPTAFLLIVLVNAVVVHRIWAEPGPSSPVEDPVSLGDRLEELGRLHLDDDTPFLQELWVLGRYHGQYHGTEGTAGEDESYETRRSRLGFQAALLDRRLTLHAQAVSGVDLEPVYNGFTELWIRWTFDEMLHLTVGQQKHRFTHERNVSSRYLQTIERGLLINMFNADYTPAITLSGSNGTVDYYTGVFSNATSADIWQAFTELNSGYSFLAAVYRDLGDAAGTDAAHLHASWVHSESEDNATNLNRFQNGLSTALILTEGPASLVTEAILALDNDAGDACGIGVQPSYFLTERLQVSGRYQCYFSNDPAGLTAQRRYEQSAGLATGELYQAGYAGLNYHLAKHRMKVMAGVEYSTLGGEDAWTIATAFRIFWGPQAPGPFPMNKMLSPR